MKKIIYFMIGTFVLVYMLQYMDKKFKNKTLRNNFFDVTKIPLLTSAIVGLSTLYIFDEDYHNSSSPANIQEIFTEVPNF